MSIQFSIHWIVSRSLFVSLRTNLYLIVLQVCYALRVCFLQIYGYQNLLFEVERLRAINYEHNERRFDCLLQSLWVCLRPEIAYERYGDHWKEIGFLGSDPKFDLQSVGFLGLHNLVYLCKNHTKFARQILLHSTNTSW